MGCVKLSNFSFCFDDSPIKISLVNNVCIVTYIDWGFKRCRINQKFIDTILYYTLCYVMLSRAIVILCCLFSLLFELKKPMSTLFNTILKHNKPRNSLFLERKRSKKPFFNYESFIFLCMYLCFFLVEFLFKIEATTEKNLGCLNMLYNLRCQKDRAFVIRSTCFNSTGVKEFEPKIK